MTDVQAQGLRTDNAYVEVRCAELQSEATAVSAQHLSLQQRLERLDVRGSTAPAHPLKADR